MSEREKKMYQSREERRAGAVRAVVELAGGRNPAEITTAEIARKMGVTDGALFRHFRSKEAVFEAVAGWVAQQMLKRVEGALAEGGSVRERLERVFLAHAEFVARFPGVPRVVFGQLQRPGRTRAKEVVREFLQAYGERVRRLLLAGQVSGEVEETVDVEAAVTGYVGALQGLVVQGLMADDMERIRELAPGVFRVYFEGIGGEG